jgi:predicted DNA-binding transcriptional regulator AlpA
VARREAPKKKVIGSKRFHFDRRAGRIADEIEGKGKPDDLLTQFEIADCLDVCRQWMWTSRAKDNGPPFVRPFPEVVRYRRSDVVKWLRARARAHAAAAEYA